MSLLEKKQLSKENIKTVENKEYNPLAKTTGHIPKRCETLKKVPKNAQVISTESLNKLNHKIERLDIQWG